jgi:hypothetical protein
MADATASDVPLDTLASEIRARIEAGDRAADKADHYRAAGLRLIDAKSAVMAAGMKFDVWLAENNIGRSRACRACGTNRSPTSRQRVPSRTLMTLDKLILAEPAKGNWSPS